MSYKFGGGSDIPESSYEVLPEGDYGFSVLDFIQPYQKENGNWVLKVKLAIAPNDNWVWAQPWSGRTSAGDDRDGIGDFLLAINRAVPVGKAPDFDRVIGAKGRCRLKIGKDLKERPKNEVAYFYKPKEVASEQRPKTHSQEELNQARREAEKKAGNLDDIGPDDIPF